MTPLQALAAVFFLMAPPTTGPEVSRSGFLKAAETGDVTNLRSQLSAGADPRWTNEQGLTALMLAAANGHVEAARLLLDAGAHVDARNPGGGCRPSPSRA